MNVRKCIAIATAVSKKCPLNGKREKHARVALEVAKENDNLTKKRLPSPKPTKTSCTRLTLSDMQILLLCLSFLALNAAMQVIGVSGVDAPAAVMVGSTYLSFVAKPFQAKHDRNLLFSLSTLHRKTRTRHVAQAPAGGGLPCQETKPVLEA